MIKGVFLVTSIFLNGEPLSKSSRRVQEVTAIDGSIPIFDDFC